MNIDDIIVTKLVNVSTIFQPSGKNIPITNRRSYALSFSLGGKICYTHNGKQYLSEPQQVIFHPQGEDYNLSCLASGDFPLIEFYCDGQEFKEFQKFEIPSTQLFLPIFEQMKHNLLIPNKKAKNLSLLYELFSLLTPVVKTADSKRLSSALDLLYRSYNDPELTISSLASVCNMSECYFRRIFKRVFELSPKEYLKNLRIHQAERLLKETEKSVTEIADESGFTDVYHFSKTFKQQTKMTPSEYKKSYGDRIL